MTDRAEIERLLNRTGRTLNDLPERYPVDKIMAVGRLRGVNIKEAGKTILHQSDVIELLVSALRDALEDRTEEISDAKFEEFRKKAREAVMRRRT